MGAIEAYEKRTRICPSLKATKVCLGIGYLSQAVDLRTFLHQRPRARSLASGQHAAFLRECRQPAPCGRRLVGGRRPVAPTDAGRS